jgi:hypothetical protein
MFPRDDREQRSLRGRQPKHRLPRLYRKTERPGRQLCPPQRPHIAENKKPAAEQRGALRRRASGTNSLNPRGFSGPSAKPRNRPLATSRSSGRGDRGPEGHDELITAEGSFALLDDIETRAGGVFQPEPDGREPVERPDLVPDPFREHRVGEPAYVRDDDREHDDRLRRASLLHDFVDEIDEITLNVVGGHRSPGLTLRQAIPRLRTPPRDRTRIHHENEKRLFIYYTGESRERHAGNSKYFRQLRKEKQKQ